MPKHGKSKDNGKSNASKESKTVRLSTIAQDIKALQEKIADYGSRIEDLNYQYEKEVKSRSVYAKSTGNKLSETYDKQAAASAKLEQKEALYEAIAAEPESSSSDESRKSKGSKHSGHSGSSKSSRPAIEGWDCGNCSRTNYTTPDGPDNICGCGHRFCDVEAEVVVLAGYDRDGIEIFRTELVPHCSVQWNP